MNLKKLTVISLSLLAFSTGCTVIPGSGLPTGSKTIVYNENDTAENTALDSRVNVYPITLNLVQSMRQPQRFAQPNAGLSAQNATASAAAMCLM